MLERVILQVREAVSLALAPAAFDEAAMAMAPAGNMPRLEYHHLVKVKLTMQ